MANLKISSTKPRLYNYARKKQRQNKHDTIKEFDQQMTTGKISNALRCQDETQKGQVLALNDIRRGKSVYQILIDKHPQPSEVSEKYSQIRGRDDSSPTIWTTKISAHFGDNNIAQMWLPVTWLNTIWLNFFVESFGLKILSQVTTKLSQN